MGPTPPFSPCTSKPWHPVIHSLFFQAPLVSPSLPPWSADHHFSLNYCKNLHTGPHTSPLTPLLSIHPLSSPQPKGYIVNLITSNPCSEALMTPGKRLSHTLYSTFSATGAFFSPLLTPWPLSPQGLCTSCHLRDAIPSLFNSYSSFRLTITSLGRLP